jgi:hypothetical protein
MKGWMLMLGLAAGCTPVAESCVDPALRLHGHNDYLQPVPLVRALELGLGSLEADIYLNEGELRVGHELWQLRSGCTLQSLYLDPLYAEFKRGGSLRSDGEPLVLLVDIKADGAKVYQHLRGVLMEYRDMLTTYRDGATQPGAVTVILSGSRPRGLVAADDDRLCAIDGRFGDLDIVPLPPVNLVPWISGSWRGISDWTGSDDLMSGELQRVNQLVAKAHAQGRCLRFWGAPDRYESWGAFLDLGIDRIGTDQPKKAVRWLREHRSPTAR